MYLRIKVVGHVSVQSENIESHSAAYICVLNQHAVLVPRARIELALPKKPDFESGASTSSATPAQQGAIIAAIAREWEGLSILF